MTEEITHMQEQANMMLKARFLKKDGEHERRILTMAHILFWFDVYYIQTYKINIINKTIKTFKRIRKLKFSNLHRIITKTGFQRFQMVHGGMDLPTSIMQMDTGKPIYSPVRNRDIRDKIAGVFPSGSDSFQFSIGMDDIYALITMDGMFSFTKS